MNRHGVPSTVNLGFPKSPTKSPRPRSVLPLRGLRISAVYHNSSRSWSRLGTVLVFIGQFCRIETVGEVRRQIDGRCEVPARSGRNVIDASAPRSAHTGLAPKTHEKHVFGPISHFEIIHLRFILRLDRLATVYRVSAYRQNLLDGA